MNIKVLFLIIISIIILVLLCIAAFQFRSQAVISNSKKASDAVNAESVASAAPQPASPSAAPVSLDKDNLKIEVLNGSEISGQAAKVKLSLANLGFKNVLAGNADEATSSSFIKFSNNMPQARKDLLLNELKQIIILGISPENTTDFDISLTIGRNFKSQ